MFVFITVRNHFFSTSTRVNFWMLITIFYIIAIPYTIYHLVKKGNETRQYKNGLNIIGTLFTLPLFFITLLLYYGFPANHSQNINAEDVHLYTSEGKEINTTDYDSFMKDTGNISRVKIDDIKSE